VVEIAPGAGWYTEILAPYLRERGRLYAAHYAADAPEEGRRRARRSFDAKLAQDPAVYDRVRVGTLPRDGKNHPNGVWSLPPTLRGGDTDRAKFLAIGE
jgi:predicted methyltransferase